MKRSEGLVLTTGLATQYASNKQTVLGYLGPYSKCKRPFYRKGLEVGVVLLPLIGGVPGLISMPLPKAFSSISDI